MCPCDCQLFAACLVEEVDTGDQSMIFDCAVFFPSAVPKNRMLRMSEESFHSRIVDSCSKDFVYMQVMPIIVLGLDISTFTTTTNLLSKGCFLT